MDFVFSQPKHFILYVLSCLYYENKNNSRVSYPISIGDLTVLLTNILKYETELQDCSNVFATFHNVRGTHSPRKYHIGKLQNQRIEVSADDLLLVHWLSRDYQDNKEIQEALKGNDNYSWSDEIKQKAEELDDIYANYSKYKPRIIRYIRALYPLQRQITYVISKREKQILDQLQFFKNLILEGVPGTGKTHSVKAIIDNWPKSLGGNAQGEYAITFHPSSSYEDFVEGIRPISNINDFSETQLVEWFYELPSKPIGGNWGIQDGFFVRVCQEAYKNPDLDYVVLIDEINRANIPKVFGDLITTIESSKRAEYVNGEWDKSNCQLVVLPYSKRKFFVPANIYILATQNTSDHSVAPLDAALRRRFAFSRIEPQDLSILQANIRSNAFQESLNVWWAINQVLLSNIGPDALLGHSYFYVVNRKISGETEEVQRERLALVWGQELLPQVVETVVSANRIELIEDINVLIYCIDTGLNFKIDIKGDGLYQLPLIERLNDWRINIPKDIFNGLTQLYFDLNEFCEIQQGKQPYHNRFHLKEKRSSITGINTKRRFLHIEPNGDILLQQEPTRIKMNEYLCEQMTSHAIFNTGTCAEVKAGGEDMIRIPKNIWLNNQEDLSQLLLSMLKQEFKN